MRINPSALAPAMLALAAAAAAVAAAATATERLPGVGDILFTADLPTLEATLPVFALRYDDAANRTAPVPPFQPLPDGVSYISEAECTFAGRFVYVGTMAEHYDWQADAVSVPLGYRGVVGALTYEPTGVRHTTFLHESVKTIVASRCNLYRLTVQPGFVPLDPRFLERAAALPTRFSELNRGQFRDFLSDYGHAFTRSVVLGGELLKTAYTSRAYVDGYGVADVETNARADFVSNFANGPTVRPDGVSDAYMAASRREEVIARGGAKISLGGYPWEMWVDSLQERPVGVKRDMLPISELFSDEYCRACGLESRREAVEQALDEFLLRPGCLRVDADNYDFLATVDDESDCQFGSSAAKDIVLTERSPILIPEAPADDTICFLTAVRAGGDACRLYKQDGDWWLAGSLVSGDDAPPCAARCVSIASLSGVAPGVLPANIYPAGVFTRGDDAERVLVPARRGVQCGLSSIPRSQDCTVASEGGFWRLRGSSGDCRAECVIMRRTLAFLSHGDEN